MADNYIERKMEEHARGKSTPASRRTAAPQAGKAVFSFPCRRIAIAGDGDIAEAIVAIFATTGSKVAFACNDSRRGSDLAHELGIRCIPAAEGRIENLARDLLRAWLGLDILICIGNSSAANALIDSWLRYRDRYKIPDSYMPRIITVGDTAVKASGITGHCICPEGRSPARIAELCLMFSLPAADVLPALSV